MLAMDSLKFYRNLGDDHEDFSILEISIKDFLPIGCHLGNSSLSQTVGEIKQSSDKRNEQ